MSITRVDLSHTTLAAIQSYAFADCVCLEEVLFPPTLATLGAYAFQCCCEVTRVDLSHTRLAAIEKGAFYGCDALVSVLFPPTLRTIGKQAFRGCISITNLRFPPKLTTIGQSAFNRCCALTDLALPMALTTLGAWYERTPSAMPCCRVIFFCLLGVHLCTFCRSNFGHLRALFFFQIYIPIWPHDAHMTPCARAPVHGCAHVCRSIVLSDPVYVCVVCVCVCVRV